MARINVEDSLISDHRFLDLVGKLGTAQYALGVVVWAFRIAQKHYLTTDNDRCIPFDEWKKQGCDDRLLDVGLAVRKEKGIWMVGSEEQFHWLLQKQEAGKKSAESRKSFKSEKTKRKRKNEQPSTGVNERSTTDAHSSTSVEPLSSFLSSLSSSLSIPSSVLSQVVEHVYKIYPRKQGFQAGRKILLGDLKTREDCVDLQNAVWRYKTYVSDPNRSVEHVYGFKGFARVWRDWIPEDNG